MKFFRRPSGDQKVQVYATYFVMRFANNQTVIEIKSIFFDSPLRV